MIEVAADGWYHPETSKELQALIRKARRDDSKVCVRTRGAGLSTKAAIPEKKGKPPAGITGISLDRMRAVQLSPQNDGTAIVEVQAGCLMGPAYDDSDGSSWPRSLSYILHDAGYALSQTAGVSHQAIGGFLQTSSAGGSIKHSLYDDLLEVELVDGEGEVRCYPRSADPNDDFWGVGTAMGLCGVVTKVKLRAYPRYNVKGHELTVDIDDATMDIFGDGDRKRPSLAQYLTDMPYARILWWPQKDLNRVQIWEIPERLVPSDDFEPRPFEIMGRFSSLMGSLLLTIIGNTDDLDAVPPRLGRWADQFDRWLDREPSTAGRPVFADQPPRKRSWRKSMERVWSFFKQKLDAHPSFNPGSEADDEAVRELLAKGTTEADERDWSDRVTDGLMFAIKEVLDGKSGEILGNLIQELSPSWIDELLDAFVPKEDKHFQDWWLCGLPMDNSMEEALWHTEFTELWIPLDKAKDAVCALRDYYAAGGDEDLAYQRAGPFALELYGGAGNGFWMSPGYGGHCLRVNVFWFAGWEGRSRAEFYQGIWDTLEPFGFRVHWGKNAPGPSAEWVAHHRKQLVKMGAFMDLRKRLDPDGIFVSDYFKQHLGIED